MVGSPNLHAPGTGETPVSRLALPRLLLYALLFVCCGLPIVWMIIQVASHPHVWAEATLDAFRLRLIGRTIVYNGLAAIVATLLAMPVAMVIGRGRGVVARVVIVLLPVGLFIPSIVYTYGWKQVFRLMHLDFLPASPGDVGRCIWTLATWLWPIPAGLIGLALRQVDQSVQQAALVDGAYWRVTLRQLATPIVAALACAALLAMQEFAVYEPSGISVVATEVRMVFDTGAFSSPDNPITQPIVEPSVSTSVGAGFPRPASEDRGVTPPLQAPEPQKSRAAAAIVVGTPLLLIVGLLAVVALIASRRWSIEGAIDVGPWPPALNASLAARLASIGVIFISLVVPIGGLVLSLHRPWNSRLVWREFGQELIGSLTLAGLGGIGAIVLAFLAIHARPRGVLLLAIMGFLVGGQFLAIAQIHLYNRSYLGWVYNSPVIVVMTYLARFGWIALLAGRSTWSHGWRELRDMSAIDGAGAAQTSRRVILPIALPLIGAMALLVIVLCLGEVPATVLIQPLRPPTLIPLMMTWVHNLRFDPMIEASLVMVGTVIVFSAGLTLLLSISRRVMRRARVLSVLGLAVLILNGCDTSNQPKEIWAEPGKTRDPLVYPRGIARSPVDNSIFVVDRTATIQHLDSNGNFLNAWRMPERDHGKPVGLSVGPDGNVYVPDTHYHRVIVYTPAGKEIRRWGSEGTAAGQFIYPTDVAFDKTGNVYVSEYGDHDRIQVFDGQGNFLRQFGRFGHGDGEFSRPQSMLIDGETMYITDSCNHRIVVFTIDGKFVRNFGGVGTEAGQYRFPYGLDRDADGNLIVCEFGNNRVQRIDPKTGKGLATWGSPGHDRGQLAYPWACVVDDRQRVITVDSGNNRLQVFEF